MEALSLSMTGSPVLSEVSSNVGPIKQNHAFVNGKPYQIFRSTIIYPDDLGNVKFYNVRTKEETTHKVHKSKVVELKVEDDKLCTASKKRIKVWDLNAEDPFNQPIKKIRAVNPYQRDFNGAVIFTNFKSTSSENEYENNINKIGVEAYRGSFHLGTLEKAICLKDIYIGVYSSNFIHIFDGTKNEDAFFNMDLFHQMVDQYGFCQDQFITLKKTQLGEDLKWELAAYPIYVSELASSLFSDFFESEDSESEPKEFKKPSEMPKPAWTYSVETQNKKLEFDFDKTHFSYRDGNSTFVLWPSKDKVENVIHLKDVSPIVSDSHIFICEEKTLYLLNSLFFDGSNPDFNSLTPVADIVDSFKNLTFTDGIVYFEDALGLNSVDFREKP